MKILLVSPLPPPHGGISGWTIKILDYYQNRQSDFEIIHQDTAVQSREITNTSIIPRILSGVKETKSAYSILKKNLTYKKPDLIHITSSANLALIKDIFLVRLASKRRVPCVIHFRFGRIPQIQRARNWEWWLLCKVIGISHRTIVVDRKSYDILLLSGFKNITYIPNPVSFEIERIALDLKQNLSERKKGKVIFVGHVISNKGVFELINASVTIPEITELIIIGPYEKKVKDQLIALAKDRDKASWICFTGNLEKEDVLNHLKDSAVLVLPSYTEGFPNVILEAMAMGCAVIASEVGAIPEMLNINSAQPCGICIKPKKVTELKSALEYLLSDIHKVNWLGKNGIERVLTNYTMSIVSREYEKLWSNIL